MKHNAGSVFVADCPLRSSPREPEAPGRPICQSETVRIIEQMVEHEFDCLARLDAERRSHETLARRPKTGAHVRIARHQTAALIDRQSLPDPKAVDADIALCPDGFVPPSRAECLRRVLDDEDVRRYRTHEISDARGIGQGTTIVRCDNAKCVVSNEP